MTDVTSPETRATNKGGKLGLIIGFVLSLLGGAVGFYATSNGLILGSESSEPQAEAEASQAVVTTEVAFVPLPPISVSLPSTSAYKHLKFRAELETPRKHVDEVQRITPRVIDVLNGYLRAVEVSELERPASLTRLRAQMLRRAQIVAGPGLISDLLVMEFVLN